jgi:hypothetical protein
MHHVATDEVIRRALRAQVCPTCRLRPEGSESLGPLAARLCEGTCTIFETIDELTAIAERFAGDPLASYERAINDGICQHCTAAPTAGDYCSERFHRTCPLTLEAANVLTIIEALLPTNLRVA